METDAMITSFCINGANIALRLYSEERERGHAILIYHMNYEMGLLAPLLKSNFRLFG